MVRKMFVLIAQFKIQEGHCDAVVAALVEDAGSSVSVEPGCYQFDVSQDESDPNTIYAYEIYADEDAFEAHTRTPHLAKWREASQDVIEARVIYRGSTIFPDDSKWKGG